MSSVEYRGPSSGVGASFPPTADLPMNNHTFTGLKDPINPQDAGTKAYADTKVAQAGLRTAIETLFGSAVVVAQFAAGAWPTLDPTILADGNILIFWFGSTQAGLAPPASSGPHLWIPDS